MSLAIKGRACIRVTDSMLQYAPIKIEKPAFGEIRWGTVEVKEVFDTIHSFLLFPEDYSIVGVYFDPMMQSWSIVVESEHILLPSPGQPIPYLSPLYERSSDGKVRIVDMQLPIGWKYYAGEADAANQTTA